MAKLTRKLFKIFGGSGATSNFGQFGSLVAGSPNNTKDILTIQGLTAWDDGWQDAVFAANKAPFLEDMNAKDYVYGYEIAYILENGVAEYDATTTYYIGSLVKKTGTSEIYMSLTDTNLGNALPSKTTNANWQYVINKGILQYDSTYSYSVGEIAQKPGTAQLYMSLTSSNVGNPLPAQVTTAIWQYLVDLANLAPPPVGVQQIKFGFAHLQITSASSVSATVAKNPTGDFGFAADMTVYAFVMLTHTNFNMSAGSATAFSTSYAWAATLIGSGVDASATFLNGGSPSNTYTLKLDLSVTSTLGQGVCVCDALVVFIGVK